jgi:hypothetical protein
MKTKPNSPDPVIDEIREVRRQISSKCGHDPEQLAAYYQELQKQYADRLIGASSKTDQPAA